MSQNDAKAEGPVSPSKEELEVLEDMEIAQELMDRRLEKEGLKPDYSCLEQHDWRPYEISREQANDDGTLTFELTTICEYCGAAGIYRETVNFAKKVTNIEIEEWCEGHYHALHSQDV